MSIKIDIHALQTIPPSLINRDDLGAPKSARFGGVQRQRVSSQSWKRAIRLDFAERFPAEKLGHRTRQVGELIVKQILEITEASGERWDEARAVEGVKQLFAATKLKLVDGKKAVADNEDLSYPEIGYLLFLGNRQIAKAAEAIVTQSDGKFSKKQAQEILDTEHAIDVALFGRMVADDSAFNVDAAVQFAHAIGIHEAEPEFDYFTAVDDSIVANEETGAGMIGTTQMMSSTLYRFASVDLDSLQENLGDSNTAVDAAVGFIDSFITALPSGKQNSFAHNTLPELVYVTVTDGRSVSLVNAFEKPVAATADAGRRLVGARALAAEAAEVQRVLGISPVRQFVVALGELGDPFADFAENTSVPELSEKLAEQLRALIQEG